MKQIVLASLAALTLSIAFTACKKTESAPTNKAATMPNLQSVMKPYSTRYANHIITAERAEAIWTKHTVIYQTYDNGPDGYRSWMTFDGCTNTGDWCITRVQIVNIVVPSSPNDSTAIAQNDYSAPSADFIGGTLFETGDSTKPYMFIFEQGVSNVDQYFANPATIAMKDIPLEWPTELGGYKERIKAGTRSGRIITKNGRRFLEIFIYKEDIDSNVEW